MLFRANRITAAALDHLHLRPNGCWERTCMSPPPRTSPSPYVSCYSLLIMFQVLSWMSSQGLFPLEYIVHVDPDFFKRIMPEVTTPPQSSPSPSSLLSSSFLLILSLPPSWHRLVSGTDMLNTTKKLLGLSVIRRVRIFKKSLKRSP
jgi:hypothetical protein